MKSRGGGTLKITTIYKPVEQIHCVEVFTDYHMKRASMCYLKIYIKVYLMH